MGKIKKYIVTGALLLGIIRYIILEVSAFLSYKHNWIPVCHYFNNYTEGVFEVFIIIPIILLIFILAIYLEVKNEKKI